MSALRSLLSGENGRYAARTGWPWPAAIAVALLIFGTSALAGIVGDRIFGMLAGAPAPGDGGDRSAEAMLPFLVSMQLAQAGMLVALTPLFQTRPRSALALGPPPAGWRDYALGLAGLIAIVAVFDVAALLLFPEPPTGDLKPFVGMIRSDLWWLTLIAVGIGAPLSEELLFRGFLQSALAQTRLGFLGASIATTAVWTLLHASYSVLGLTQVALVGLYLSWVLWRTGSLRVTMFCHAVYNTLVVLLLAVVPLPG